MSVLQQSPGYRCRHVVFTAAPPRRPLNLGARAAMFDGGVSAAEFADSEGQPHTQDDAFAAWVLSRAGLDPHAYRRSSLHRRVPACLRALRAKSVGDARRLLLATPSRVPAAADALLIGVTSFFRDAPVFSGILDHLLPALAAAADAGRRLRVWSAACSDGAELYSVAMLLAELDVLHRCELLGTDCRADAVARAEAAVYDASACQAIPPALLHRNLEPADGATPAHELFDWRDHNQRGPRHRRAHGCARGIQSRLRDAVAWRVADVLDRPEPGPWDVILCRNLAMYLRPSAAERLWRALAAELRPGGLLVVGKAERPTGAAATAGLAPVGPCVYRRGDAA